LLWLELELELCDELELGLVDAVGVDGVEGVEGLFAQPPISNAQIRPAGTPPASPLRRRSAYSSPLVAVLTDFIASHSLL
jgi:hypothetical protein